MKTTLLILVMLFLSSCSSNTNNWPYRMTPFFAECQTYMKVYTDNAYAVRKRMPCKGGWKFYDRGEPTLTND